MERALSKLRAKSSKDLTTPLRDYPSDPSCYELLEDCGRGVSATVHRAFCKPTNEIVAVKKMNLERVSMNLDDIIHEAQTMKSYNHPNVLPLYTSFVHGQDLWMVTPFMSGGSILHIMKYRFPTGLDEVSIATIMKYVLLGLEYVHKNGGIHRDVKAGNILMDKDGTVRLGDFGVAATPAARDGEWCDTKNQQRTTFVGTPCWMAPEVMEQASYNSKADIWSVGITLLELAKGHAPFAKLSPMKVLLMTLQGPAPKLDDQPGRPHFSKHMRNIIARCLQKEAHLRPTATELLQDKFFKQARDEEYLGRLLLDQLPALGERVQMIREGKAATNAAENDRQLERSQEEYKRGVSMWNFDVASLKAQAAVDDSEASRGLASIAEEPQQQADGEGSGSSSRRSTDDAAGISPTAAAAAAAASVGTAAAAAAAAPVDQQQQPAELVQPPQQQQQPLQAPSLQPVSSLDVEAAHAVVQQQQQQLQEAEDGAGAAAASQQQQQQQQQQSNMRRAASAFAGSHALAAAAADMGGSGSGAAGSSSSSAPGLAGQHSEPVSQQGSGIPNHQQSSSGMPPPAPYAGAAYTGLSSGSLAGAGASSGGSSYCLSPPNTSPPMSRESSSQGLLSSLAHTPDASQLRGKSKGRFQVYEHGVPAPPLSPGTRSGTLQEGLSGSFTKSTAAATLAAAAAAGAAAADGAPPGPPNLARMSDSTGATTETPRAGRQVLNPAEAAELKAAAVAATAAAGTTGGGAAPPAAGSAGAAGTAAAAAGAPAAATGDASGVTGTGTCPTPPPGTGSAAAAAAAAAAAGGLALPGMGTGGTPSVEGGDAPAAAPEPKKKGRFKIIEEENPSRGPSKVPSSADLSAAARAAAAAGGSGSGRGLGSVAGVLPELLRLHEQSVTHANALARVIDSVRSSCSGGNLADDLAAPLAAAAAAAAASAGAGGALPPRKPAAAGVGGGGLLSRVNSKGVLGAAGQEARVVSLQQLLQESNGDSMDVAEKLYERVQDLERQVAGLEVELGRYRPTELLRLRPLDSTSTTPLGSTLSAAPSGLPESSADTSRTASRRTSVANLALSAASHTAAAAAAGGGGGAGASGVDRHSSSGASGGGVDSGGGATPPA